MDMKDIREAPTINEAVSSGKDGISNVFNFDVIDGREGSGSASKAVVMVPGRYLKELFDEVKNNPNTSYVTCVNDLILNSTWEEFQNFPVPVFVKEVRAGNTDFGHNEVMFSRMANTFGLKTVFCFPLNGDYSLVASVNVPKNLEDSNINNPGGGLKSEQIVSINDFIDDKGESGPRRNSSLEEWLWYFKDALKKHPETRNIPKEQIYDIVSDIVFEYFIRKYVFNDRDYWGINSILMHSGDFENLRHGPSMDYEFCNGITPNKEAEAVHKSSFEVIRDRDIAILMDPNICPPEIRDRVVLSIKNTLRTRFPEINQILETHSKDKNSKDATIDLMMTSISELGGLIAKWDNVYNNSSNEMGDGN